MWEKIKEMLFNLWGTFTCLVVLAHLVLIEIYGSVVIYENWAWIRYTEFVMIIGFLILGVERIVRDLRSWYAGKHNG